MSLDVVLILFTCGLRLLPQDVSDARLADRVLSVYSLGLSRVILSLLLYSASHRMFRNSEVARIYYVLQSNGQTIRRISFGLFLPAVLDWSALLYLFLCWWFVWPAHLLGFSRVVHRCEVEHDWAWIPSAYHALSWLV